MKCIPSPWESSFFVCFGLGFFFFDIMWCGELVLAEATQIITVCKADMSLGGSLVIQTRMGQSLDCSQILEPLGATTYHIYKRFFTA